MDHILIRLISSSDSRSQSSDSNLNQRPLYPSGFRFPKITEAEGFITFRQSVDDILSKAATPFLPIQNDETYETLFNFIGNALKVEGTKASKMSLPRSSHTTEKIRDPLQRHCSRASTRQQDFSRKRDKAVVDVSALSGVSSYCGS